MKYLACKKFGLIALSASALIEKFVRSVQPSPARRPGEGRDQRQPWAPACAGAAGAVGLA
jgi:hypothetical protein